MMNDPSALWASGSLGDWQALVSSYDTRIGEHKVSEHERYFFPLFKILVCYTPCMVFVCNAGGFEIVCLIFL